MPRGCFIFHFFSLLFIKYDYDYIPGYLQITIINTIILHSIFIYKYGSKLQTIYLVNYYCPLQLQLSVTITVVQYN